MKKVSVDIVCEGGDCWVKVVARNPRALDLNSQVLEGYTPGPIIVCEGGDCWVKVVARNPRALDLNS